MSPLLPSSFSLFPSLCSLSSSHYSFFTVSKKSAQNSIRFYPWSFSPQSAIRNPQSAFRNPHSAIRNPQSAIHNPQSALPPSPTRSSSFRGTSAILLQSTINNPKLPTLPVVPPSFRGTKLVPACACRVKGIPLLPFPALFSLLSFLHSFLLSFPGNEYPACARRVKGMPLLSAAPPLGAAPGKPPGALPIPIP